MTDDDGVPTPEQLRRIERGVMRRIDLRRLIARRIAGGVVAVAVLGGGIGLVVSAVQGGSIATSGVSSAGRAEPAAGPLVAVRCATTSGGDDRQATIRVSRAGLPGSALDACTVAEFGDARTASGSGSTTGTGTTPSPTAAPLVLCVDVDGTYTVLPRHGAAASTCVGAGMEPYTP